MWTADNRPRYNRDKLRYPSDLTDAEWAHIEPLIPPGKPGGGKRRVAIREVINGCRCEPPFFSAFHTLTVDRPSSFFEKTSVSSANTSKTPFAPLMRSTASADLLRSLSLARRARGS